METAVFPNHVFGEVQTFYYFRKNARQKLLGLFAFDFNFRVNEGPLFGFNRNKLGGFKAVLCGETGGLGGIVALGVF